MDLDQNVLADMYAVHGFYYQTKWWYFGHNRDGDLKTIKDLVDC